MLKSVTDGGYLTNDLFSAIVGMILITTFITPPLLRVAFHHKKSTPPIALQMEISLKEENIMSSMVWFVLHDAGLLADVLAAWKECRRSGNYHFAQHRTP